MAMGGFDTAEDFEARIPALVPSVSLSRGLWSRYLRGEVIPQGGTADRRSNLIQKLSGCYPAAAEVFYHPFWKLIDFRRLLSPDELRDMLLQMGMPVWRSFVDVVDIKGKDWQPDSSRFWNIECEATHQDLLEIPGWNGAAASLILTRMRYLAQDEVGFVNYLSVAQRHLLSLAGEEPYADKRMHSVLLVLEGLCLQHAYQLVMMSPCLLEESWELRREITKWSMKWSGRCQRHQRSLSDTARSLFIRWIDEAVQYGSSGQKLLRFGH